MQEILTFILDEVRGAWRFRRWALVSAWTICIVGWLVVLNLPNKYEATARVFVDPSTALKPVIQGLAIEQDLNAEFNLVRQSLLSEPQLRKVIEETGMGGAAVTPAQRAGIVEGLRNRIEIALQRNPDEQNAGPTKIYAIRYLDTTRERSLKVVQILLNNLMEQTLGGKRQASVAGQKFLETQIKDYEKRLSEAEDRLADFKKNNVGMVPDQNGGQSDYFSRLQAEMDEVKRAQTAFNLAAARRDALQRQLRGEAPIAASGGMGSSPGGLGNAGGDTVSQIKATQAKLDDLLLRYTDKHPDVVSARETLVQLEKRRKDEIEALKRGDPNAAAITGASLNPVYQNIQLQLHQAEIEVVAARSAVSDHQSKVAELRRMVDTMPQVEAEFARLNRDYTVTKAQHQALLQRLESARLGEEAEATGSIRFEVIEPPAVGFKPVSPNRLLFLVAVLGAGLAGGIALAYLLNKLQPVFNDVHSLADATGLPVLGAISLSRTDAASQELKRSYLRYCGAVGVLMALFAIVVLIGQYISPMGGS